MGRGGEEILPGISGEQLRSWQEDDARQRREYSKTHLTEVFSKKRRSKRKQAWALLFAWEEGISEDEILHISGLPLDQVRSLIRDEIVMNDGAWESGRLKLHDE